MRIVAIFFVIFNHTAKNGFWLFSLYPPDSFQYWTYLFLSVFCKFSVPLFFAISGALLLGNDQESIRTVWAKRILKILVVLVAFSFLYFLRSCVTENHPINFYEFIIRLYQSNWNYSFWYLYVFLAYLMCLPFLRVLVKGLTKKRYYYLIGMSLAFDGILPVLQYLLWNGTVALNGDINVSSITGMVTLYPCIGYFLEHKLDLQNCSKKLVALWGANFLCIAMSCYMTYYKSIVTGDIYEWTSQIFFNSFVLVNCITIFISVKYWFQKIVVPNFWERLVCSMGASVFTVYLMHVGIMESSAFCKIWIVFHEKWHLNYMASAFLFCFLVLAAGYLITLVIRVLFNCMGIK